MLLKPAFHTHTNAKQSQEKMSHQNHTPHGHKVPNKEKKRDRQQTPTHDQQLRLTRLQQLDINYD